MYIRFEWLGFVEINCTRKTFSHFDKKIALVCDWFLRRCTVCSRYLKPSRDIEKVQATRSSSYQELRTKDRKIRKRRFYHIPTFVFQFIQCTLQSNLISVSLPVFFSKLVRLLFFGRTEGQQNAKFAEESCGSLYIFFIS